MHQRQFVAGSQYIDNKHTNLFGLNSYFKLVKKNVCSFDDTQVGKSYQVILTNTNYQSVDHQRQQPIYL